MTEPSVNASTTALSTTQGQELSNLQALISLVQQLQAGSLSIAPSSSGTPRAEKGRKRKLSESSDNSGDSSDSASDSDDPFVDKKKRVRVDSDKEYIDKVYDWVMNKEAEKNTNNGCPLKKSVTVRRVHDEWMLNLVDRSAKSKVGSEDGKLYWLSKRAQLISGPLFKAWSLADEKGDKETVKYIKKVVLGFGEL